jgi:maltose O-acetyltransferase
MDSVEIGNRVLISHNVNIHDGSAHSMDPIERHEHFKRITTTGHPRTWAGMPGVSAAPSSHWCAQYHCGGRACYA